MPPMSDLLNGLSYSDVFRIDDEPSVPVYRYMDFAKYCSMLATRELFLCRLDRLADPNEGRSPKGMQRHYEQVQAEGFECLHGFPSDTRLQILRMRSEEQERAAQLQQHMRRLEQRRSEVFVSCWHAPRQKTSSRNESMAMWQVYSSAGPAVRIETTLGRIRSIVAAGKSMGVARVRYSDLDAAMPTYSSAVELALSKHVAYEFEDELRVIVADDSDTEAVWERTAPGESVELRGRLLKVDLGALVMSTLVSPLAPRRLVATVSFVTSALGFDWPVNRSALLETGV